MQRKENITFSYIIKKLTCRETLLKGAGIPLFTFLSNATKNFLIQLRLSELTRAINLERNSDRKYTMSLVKKTIHLSRYFSPQKANISLNSFLAGIFHVGLRNYSASTNEKMQPSEKMEEILQNKFPKAKKIIVNDVSGGCGSMFEIFVETVEFKGLPLVKQHMLINQTLKDHIKSMHGLTVKTKIPDSEGS